MRKGLSLVRQGILHACLGSDSSIGASEMMVGCFLNE